ncbi:hypothetical protein, partial [Arenimonas sp.]|uniref:hypothetical protein n=1 Tax=Arenimonas sp. TaxID=1872635 RepID=UPI0037C06677
SQQSDGVMHSLMRPHRMNRYRQPLHPTQRATNPPKRQAIPATVTITGRGFAPIGTNAEASSKRLSNLGYHQTPSKPAHIGRAGKN